MDEPFSKWGYLNASKNWHFCPMLKYKEIHRNRIYSDISLIDRCAKYPKKIPLLLRAVKTGLELSKLENWGNGSNMFSIFATITEPVGRSKYSFACEKLLTSQRSFKNKNISPEADSVQINMSTWIVKMTLFTFFA